MYIHKRGFYNEKNPTFHILYNNDIVKYMKSGIIMYIVSYEGMIALLSRHTQPITNTSLWGP